MASNKTLGDLELMKTPGVDPATMTDADREALAAKEFKLTINGVSFVDSNGKSLFTGSTSISTMIATINGNAKANVTAKYDEISGKLIINSKQVVLTAK